MSRIRTILSALILGMGVAATAGAQQPPIPLFSGPVDPASNRRALNTLVNEINAILSPLLPAVSGAVNFISLTPATTGNNAVIGLVSGADTNAGITINPNGSGNIVLFGQLDTGILQFGNVSSFRTASGLTPCPGNGTARIAGTSNVVTGHLIVQDWLNRKHGIPVC